MTVITQEEFDTLSKLAEAIKDETRRTNALSLLNRMTEVIEGVGDRPITWQPKLVKVLQALSKTDDITGNAKPGAIVAGNEVVPNGTEVIPLMTWTSRSMWDPNKDSNRKLCSSPDGKLGYNHGLCRNCPFGNSKEPGVPPPCNKEQAFLMIRRDFSDMWRLTFHKTQYRDGKDWSDNIKNSRVHPFKRVYALNGADYEKKKQIKTIKASILDVKENEIPADELAFLEAMYHKQLEDRKAYLENFTQYVESRSAPALEHQTSDNSASLGFDAPAGDEGSTGTPQYTL